MGKFVGVSVALFVLAVGFLAISQGPEMAALVSAYISQPVLHQIAWAVIVLVPLVMLPFAVWLWDQLMRQGQAAGALAQRLDGVRSQVRDLTRAQGGVEADVQQLARSDPEDAIAALQRRVTEAEKFAQIQQGRNEIIDLDSRVGALRTQQQTLKDRLSPVLDVRRSIEQIFAELDGRQRDIERSLAEVASGDDSTALDVRLKQLVDFVRQGNARCDQIEQASKTVATLKEACAELRTRLAPLAATEDGITSRIRVLGEERDRLTAEITAIERAPDGPLAERVQKLTDDKNRLDDGIAHLSAEFGKLAALRRDAGTLVVGLDRALNTLSIAKTDEGAAGMDARIGEVSQFVEKTQGQFEEIERRVGAFEHLKGRLSDLQTRLVPLESEETGVLKLIEDLQGMREKLAEKIRRIEGGEEGDLAARVKAFAETKRELEDRVASLADQFAKLSTVRKDIAGLFDKLSSAVSASAG